MQNLSHKCPPRVWVVLSFSLSLSCIFLLFIIFGWDYSQKSMLRLQRSILLRTECYFWTVEPLFGVNHHDVPGHGTRVCTKMGDQMIRTMYWRVQKFNGFITAFLIVKVQCWFKFKHALTMKFITVDNCVPYMSRVSCQIKQDLSNTIPLIVRYDLSWCAPFP